MTTLIQDPSDPPALARIYSDAAADPPRSLARETWRRLLRSKLAMVSSVIVLLYFLVGVASLLPIHGQPDPDSSPDSPRPWLFEQKIGTALNGDKTYQPPTFILHDGAGHSHLAPPSYWLGLEVGGRSVFWRILYGTRVALLITVCASVLSISIGIVLGVVAGYFGGWVDDLITWLYSVVNSIPWLLLVIAIAYVIQGKEDVKPVAHESIFRAMFGGVSTVILALGLTDWVGLCRLMRGEVIKLRDRDFVMAGRAMGLGHARILFRHILPNTVHLIIITFSLGAVSYVQVEVILAFLGLGITDKPSWGRMIDDAKLELLRGVWWQVTAATVAIFVLSLALNLLGDFLRDALDPKLRGLD